VETLYLIVPCYNEEEVLRETAVRTAEKLTALISSGMVSQKSRVFFVDDGSTDRTWEIISGICRDNVIYSGIRLSHNCGQQNALLAGLMQAREYADITVSVDADLQDDLDVIDMMLAERQNGSEIVYGVKAPIHNEKIHRRLLADGFYRFIQIIGVDMVSHHSSCRLMGSRAMDALSGYSEVNIFLPALVHLLGFSSSVVHYKQNERFAGKTKYSIKKLFLLAMEAITSFSLKPLRLINLAAMLCLLIFGGIAVYDIFTAFAGTFKGWLLVLASVWAVGGILLLSVGVAGEYVGKTYLEAKQRPRYFIAEELPDTNKYTEKE